MEENNNMHGNVNGGFRLLSLGSNLLSQRAWLFILDFMRNEILRALQIQMVDNFSELEDTITFQICKGCTDIFSDEDVVFHIHLSITQLSARHYHEVYDALEVPVVSVGGNIVPFCRIITETYKPQIDLLIKKEIVTHYSQWHVDVNPTSFKSSHSIPLFLYINNHCHSKRFIDVDFVDLSKAISNGRYKHLCDFKRRVLKPAKDDFDKALARKENAFTLNFETKCLGKNKLITLKLCENKQVEHGKREINQIGCGKIHNSYQSERRVEEDMLIQDTLKRIKEMSWPNFEIEISRFLLHLGYGKGVVNAVKVTQRSRDGGIDGYIKCDDLGVERIFFQAKKWDETHVTIKTIREFVGAMVVQSGVKFGVLVTTSKFTKDARKYAEHIQNPRVIIIDGRELADLYLKRSNQLL